MVHNVLFDPPLPDGQRINVGNNTIIENIYSIYNLAVFKNIFRIYLTFLLIQYILIYVCVPLDDIENRPPICIISTAYTLIMVCEKKKKTTSNRQEFCLKDTNHQRCY